MLLTKAVTMGGCGSKLNSNLVPAMSAMKKPAPSAPRSNAQNSVRELAMYFSPMRPALPVTRWASSSMFCENRSPRL